MQADSGRIQYHAAYIKNSVYIVQRSGGDAIGPAYGKNQ